MDNLKINMTFDCLTWRQPIISAIITKCIETTLAAENITQAQFADNIKVVRASVSHVLSGRNKPSYEFILSIMTKYPRLNIEWLMFGKGKMYKDIQVEEVFLPESDVLFPDPISPDPIPYTEQSEESFSPIETSDNTTETIVNQRKVVKVIVLFDDGSYQEM